MLVAVPRQGPRRFDGQVAVVTGASSGIGRRLALDLASRGATVVGLARRRHLLDQLADQLRQASPSSGTEVCDVADTSAFASLLAELESSHGRIDVLVNNAGIEKLTPVAEGDLGDYRRILEVNFFGAVAGTLAVLPGMLARRSGVVVNVASDAARAPEPGHGAYSASKAALAAFSESVAHEVAGQGVHVHVLYPAWVPTAMGLSGHQDGGKLPPRAVRRSEAQVSQLVLERMGGPRIEINAAVLPLLAPIGRSLAPVSYQRAMRARSTTGR
ncbi:MAG TPA: SDR family NAD(P)-dependent oxidoreductase [Acidimicrobiales bacterium]|nr:SDR family NAD(P)-dependent oxidoreductase [Acidimicrobiales bacterium]